jgi:hypothetical protein
MNRALGERMKGLRSSQGSGQTLPLLGRQINELHRLQGCG